MSEDFIKNIALARAKKIFTRKFFETCTDSWYLDEKFYFEGLKVGINERKPTKKESNIYMKYLDELFDSYKDKFYSGPLAQDAYGKCIDCIDKILKVIEYGNNKYSEFNIDENTIKEIKRIGNIFVTKHNKFSPNVK